MYILHPGLDTVNTFFTNFIKKDILIYVHVLYNVNKGGENVTEEEMRARIVELEEENKTLKTTSETLTKAKEDNEKRINDLLDENRKLFVKITTPEDKKKPEEKEDQELSIEEFALSLIKDKKI